MNNFSKHWLIGTVILLCILVIVGWGLQYNRSVVQSASRSKIESFSVSAVDYNSLYNSWYNKIIEPYSAKLYKIRQYKDELKKNQMQIKLTTNILSLILDRVYVLKAYPINPIPSPLLDCGQDDVPTDENGLTVMEYMSNKYSNYPYKSGCNGSTTRIQSLPNSCRCMRPYLHGPRNSDKKTQNLLKDVDENIKKVQTDIDNLNKQYDILRKNIEKNKDNLQIYNSLKQRFDNLTETIKVTKSKLFQLNQKREKIFRNAPHAIMEPEMFLLGSHNQNPALALFINIVTSLSRKYPSNYEVYKFWNAVMLDYSEYRQYKDKRYAMNEYADERSALMMKSEESRLLAPQSHQTFKDELTELLAKMGIDQTKILSSFEQYKSTTSETRTFEARYNLDKAGAQIQTNRVMLMPLTRIMNNKDYSPSNFYSEHDCVYSVGPNNDDLSAEVSIATKHSTTVTRLSYLTTSPLGASLANTHYSNRNELFDKKFMKKWFVAFCLMAPYMAKEDNFSPNKAEMQYKIRQLIQAMGFHADLPSFYAFSNPNIKVDKVFLDQHYYYFQTIFFEPQTDGSSFYIDEDRHLSAETIADQALYGHGQKPASTEWPLMVMAGTSGNNQKRLMVNVPWAIHVFGLYVSSIPAIVRNYDIRVKAVPVSQDPTAKKPYEWTVEVTITKKRLDSRNGWNEAFPLYFGKHIQAFQVGSMDYPIKLFRSYIPRMTKVENPLMPHTPNLVSYPPVVVKSQPGQANAQVIQGVSDIHMLEWYPTFIPYKKRVGMVPNRPESNSNNLKTGSEEFQTSDASPCSTHSGVISMKANASCFVQIYNRSLFNHRNAVLVLEPPNAETGLSVFFDWLLDRDPTKCVQAEKTGLYDSDPNKEAERYADLLQPSKAERDHVKNKNSKTPVHLQQLTMSVKTLVLRLDEFDSNAFRYLTPSPNDSQWLNAKESAVPQQQRDAATRASEEYPKSITTLLRMHEALRLLLKNYYIVGVVSPSAVSDNIRTSKGTSMPLTDEDMYLYTVRSFKENKYSTEEPEPDATELTFSQPIEQYRTYASLVITLRRKSDVFNSLGLKRFEANKPSSYHNMNPYMLHTLLNMYHSKQNSKAMQSSLNKGLATTLTKEDLELSRDRILQKQAYRMQEAAEMRR